MASSVAPYDIYARQLLPSQRGYALFIPEPSTTLPPQYIERGVDVGDVGVIRNGSFFFVFSVCAAADDPVYHLGVPGGFQRFRLDERLFSKHPNMHEKGAEINSSITKRNTAIDDGLRENPLLSIPAGVNAGSINSSCPEAAFLNMPDGASSVDYRGLEELCSYAMRNGESWYEFVNGKLGLEAPNGSLYLVTGCDKSTTWELASVSEHVSSSCTIALPFTADQPVQGSASYECPAFVRAGPDLGGDDPLPQNQCLFIRGLRIKVRENVLMRQLKGAVKVESTQDMTLDSISSARGSNSFPGTSSFSWFSSKSSSSSRSGGGHQDLEDTLNNSDKEWSSDEEDLDHKREVYHPLNVIEKHLLETTNAGVVVTHESDWWPLSQGDVLPNDDEILERLHLHFDITTEDNGAYLAPKETFNELVTDVVQNHTTTSGSNSNNTRASGL